MVTSVELSNSSVKMTREIGNLIYPYPIFQWRFIHIDAPNTGLALRFILPLRL